jgi:hypothetical protein
MHSLPTSSWRNKLKTKTTKKTDMSTPLTVEERLTNLETGHNALRTATSNELNKKANAEETQECLDSKFSKGFGYAAFAGIVVAIILGTLGILNVSEGPQGRDGMDGKPGIVGPVGQQGPQGPAGPAGKDVNLQVLTDMQKDISAYAAQVNALREELKTKVAEQVTPVPTATPAVGEVSAPPPSEYASESGKVQSFKGLEWKLVGNFAVPTIPDPQNGRARGIGGQNPPKIDKPKDLTGAQWVKINGSDWALPRY